MSTPISPSLVVVSSVLIWPRRTRLSVPSPSHWGSQVPLGLTNVYGMFWIAEQFGTEVGGLEVLGGS